MSCGPAPLLTNELDNRCPKLHECGNHVVAVFIYSLINDDIDSLIRHLARHPSVSVNEYCECAIAYVTDAQVFIFALSRHERARLFQTNARECGSAHPCETLFEIYCCHTPGSARQFFR